MFLRYARMTSWFLAWPSVTTITAESYIMSCNMLIPSLKLVELPRFDAVARKDTFNSHAPISKFAVCSFRGKHGY